MKESTKEYLEELMAAHECRAVERGKKVADHEHVFGYFYDEELLATVVVSEAILSAYFFNKTIAEVPTLISSNADFRIRALPRLFGQSFLSNTEQSLNRREWGALCRDLDRIWGYDEKAPPKIVATRLAIIGFREIPCWNCFTRIRLGDGMQLGSDKPYDDLLLKIVCPCCIRTLYHLIKQAPADPVGVVAFAKWQELRKKTSKCLQASANAVMLALSGYREESIRRSGNMVISQLKILEEERLPCFHCKSDFEVGNGVDRSGREPSGVCYKVTCPSCNEVLFASAIGP